MDDFFQSVISAIQERFLAQVIIFRGETTLFIPADKNVEILTILRDEFQFNMLADLTSVDYWPAGDHSAPVGTNSSAPLGSKSRFHVVYQLYSMGHNLQLRLRAGLEGNAPQIRTVEEIYPNANWYEREVWDLMGIRFEGHSDPRRILMPYDWEGHPLRKDYPLGYEEPQYTFNFDEISLRKPKGQK
jgi:NADH-quinone oxidoreductase subunit C